MVYITNRQLDKENTPNSVSIKIKNISFYVPLSRGLLEKHFSAIGRATTTLDTCSHR